MFEYSQANGFSTMNYIYAGLSILILLQPLDVMIREKQLRNQKTSNSNTKPAIDLDGLDVGETVL